MIAGAVGDEEALPLGVASIDLFASTLALQWANDLPGALIQIRTALRPDGLFLAAMTGGETLTELRQSLFAAESELRGGASPRVIPAADVRDLGALLQRAGFALPVVDRDKVIVRYDTAFDLFRDLRAMGASNALTDRDRRPVGHKLFLRAAEIYAEKFSDADGRIRATFDIISLSGWAPHESQQKPARRGSGEVSLADVLGSGKRTP
jgi:SAM-dependent methyltransferase